MGYVRQELTGREKEVAGLVARGLTTREIADSLFVSIPTVKSHLRNIFRKCGVRNKVELARWWFERGVSVEEERQTEPEVAMAQSPASARAAVAPRGKWGRPVFAIALAVAAGMAAVFLSPLGSPLGADPFRVGADDPPPLPAGGLQEYRMVWWDLRSGLSAETRYSPTCKWEVVKWEPKENVLVPPEIGVLPEAGVFRCSYGPVAVKVSDGREFSLPGGSFQCYGVMMTEDGWGKGHPACDIEPILNHLERDLQGLGLTFNAVTGPDMGTLFN